MPDAPLSIFISYSRTDSEFVDRLEDDLRALNFQPWVDRRKLEGGQDWMDELQKAIDRSQILLLVLSPEAMESKYVRREYRYADQQGKPIIPLNWQPTKVPMDLNGLQWVDFQRSYDQGLYDLQIALSRLEVRTFPPMRPSVVISEPEPMVVKPQPSASPPPYTSPRISPLETPTGTSRTPAPPPIASPAIPTRETIARRRQRKRFRKTEPILWVFPFCLQIGVGASVGMLSQSWPWAVGTVAALALLSYISVYRRTFRLIEKSIIVLVSGAIVFGVTWFLSTFHYDQPQTSLLWFGVVSTVTIRHQVIFGTLFGVGLSGLFGLYFLTDPSSSNDSCFMVLLGLISMIGTILGAPVIWPIFTALGSIFDWGFGFGYGWAFILLATIAALVALTGLFFTGSIYWEDLTISRRVFKSSRESY